MSFLRLAAPLRFGACFLELSAAVGDAMQLRLPCHPDRRKTILQNLSEDLRLYTLKINIAGVWNILRSSLTVIFLNLYPTTLCIPSLLCHRWHPNSSPQYLLWNIWNVLAHSVVDGNLLTSRVSLVMPGGIVISLRLGRCNGKPGELEACIWGGAVTISSTKSSTWNDKTKTGVVAVFVCCWFWCYTWVETGCFHVCFHVWCPIWMWNWTCSRFDGSCQSHSLLHEHSPMPCQCPKENRSRQALHWQNLWIETIHKITTWKTQLNSVRGK